MAMGRITPPIALTARSRLRSRRFRGSTAAGSSDGSTVSGKQTPNGKAKSRRTGTKRADYRPLDGTQWLRASINAGIILL